MAVIVSKDNTTFATANGFWRAEAHNLSSFGALLDMTTSRQIPVTFANAGNCQGVIIALRNFASSSASNMKTITVTLQENVASVWTDRVSTTITGPNIVNNVVQNAFGSWATSFEFSVPYAVNTTVGIWRFNIVQSGSPSQTWFLRTSNGTNPFYVTWCDNALSYTANDTVIIRSYTDIDTNVSIRGTLGTGDTVNGVAMVICKHPTSGAVDNVSLLRCLTPASSYTFTVDGLLVMGAHSGFRLGTSSVPIPVAQRFNLTFLTTSTVGTRNPTIYALSANDNNEDYKQSLFFYGAVPTQPQLYTSTTANNGQPSFTLATTPTTWQIGDRVYFAKRNMTNSSSTDINLYTISSISGNTVTLSTNINNTGSAQVSANCPVINLERYGIKITTGTSSFVQLRTPGNIAISGCELTPTAGLNLNRSVGQNGGDDDGNVIKWTFSDNTVYCTSIPSQQFIFSGIVPIPQKGMDFKRNNMMGRHPIQQLGFTPNLNQGYGITSGNIEFTDNISYATLNGIMLFNYNDGIYSRNQIYHHTGNAVLQHATLSGANMTVDDNYVWGAGNATLSLSNFINPASWARNKFNRGQNAPLTFISGAVIGTSIDDEFGVEFANSTNDIRIDQSVYSQWQFSSVGGSPLVDKTNIRTTVNGTYISFPEYNNVANDDRTILKYGDFQRTGTGLADTTVHNGGFALRLASQSTAGRLEWTQNMPTGNIQSKTMAVGVWVKINNSAYWAGTNQLPRITVKYDNATEVYGQAAQTTDWQFIFVPFTPTTTYGQIEVTLSTMTDATTSNAYVYFDDITAPLPQGSELNLGAFDLWANALPVMPSSFATAISANDVWAADPDGFGTGTVGEKVNKIKKIVTGLQ